jgi:hypothetical protein
MLEEGWPEYRYVESCIDYRTYLSPLDIKMTAAVHSVLTEKLLRLGMAEQERMGVIYVRGPWGFLVIPRAGFPELRVSFYHDTLQQNSDAVLASITAALVDSHAASSLIGDKNE